MDKEDEQGVVLEHFTLAMKRDWDWRARENAKWFINTYKLEQSEEEFDETGRRDFERFIKTELDVLTDGRDPGQLRVLEIGCGTGRMTRHFAELFGEVHGVDVSGEMVRKATERLSCYPNLTFHETNGIDFSVFPDEHFDLIFSAHVFQHVPSPDIIGANIRDAFRCLRRRGILNFQTNGITSVEFSQTPKDTWTGTGFGEAELRTLANEIGALLVGIKGENTQYCWSLFRKPGHVVHSGRLDSPEILACSGADDLPGGMLHILDGEVILTLIATGLDREKVDASRVSIEFQDQTLKPHYVGIVRKRAMSYIPQNYPTPLVQVDVCIRCERAVDDARLRVKVNGSTVSEFVTIKLPEPGKTTPRIQLVTNVPDGGLDIHARGPKSLIRLFVFDSDALEDPGQVRVVVNNRELVPISISYLTSNAVWEIKTQIPEDIAPGPLSLVVRRGDLDSNSYVIEPKEGAEC